MGFDKLALFSGRPIYWTTNEFSGLEHAQQLMTLFVWCVSLPRVRLGIYPRGLAQIIVSVFAQAQAPLPDGLEQLLRSWAVSLEEPPPWGLDARIWGPHIEPLIQLLARAQRDGLLWVTPEEAGWWISATAASIIEYGQHPIDSSALLSLLSRHHCVLFAPFAGPAVYDRLNELLVTKSPDIQQRNRAQLANLDISRTSLADPRLASACWSWKLLEFGVVGEEGSVVCLPQLALWSDWPASRLWAPPRPQMHPSGLVFSAEEAANFLDDLLWKQVETVFGVARNVCRLGIAEPTLGPRESRPPVFYFASPVSPPVRPEGYAQDGASAIQPIIRKCLAAPDPFSEGVAWGTLEGELVALRSERATSNSYLLWYLLLPTAAHAKDAASNESDAASSAESLGYLEFSIGHEARDIFTDLEPLQNRRALFGGSLDVAGNVIADAIDLFQMLSRQRGGYFNKTLPGLHMLMQRVHANAEKVHSDSVQLQGRYDNYVDSTDDFFRRRVTFSPLPNPQCINLRVSVRQAYPYEYLRQPLESHVKGIDEVRATLSGLISSLDTFNQQLQTNERESFARRATVIGIVLTIVSVIGALAQIFGISISGISVNSVDDISLPFGLFISVHDVAILGLGLLLVAGVYIIVNLLSHFFSPGNRILLSSPWRFRHHPWRFRSDLQRLHEKIDRATQILLVTQEAKESNSQTPAPTIARSTSDPGVRLEQLDQEATHPLAGMWQRLKYENRPSSGNALKRWAQRERRLEYVIQLFDLAPDTIPLPRALCVFRFKSAEYRGYTMIADWQFESSLGSVGIASDLSQRLEGWLSAPVNQRQIREMDVMAFAQALKDHGVSADPDKRKPNLWQGDIK